MITTTIISHRDMVHRYTIDVGIYRDQKSVFYRFTLSSLEAQYSEIFYYSCKAMLLRLYEERSQRVYVSGESPSVSRARARVCVWCIKKLRASCTYNVYYT